MKKKIDEAQDVSQDRCKRKAVISAYCDMIEACNIHNNVYVVYAEAVTDQKYLQASTST